MGKSIVLTGMMGSGKTTVAKQLAVLLPQFKLIETDFEIEKDEQLSISKIFDKYGESYFREKETSLLKNFCDKNDLIISLGGGTFLSETNRKLLEKSFTVYLAGSAETLYNRIKNDKSRPLLNCKNPEQKVYELLQEREKYYQKARLEINTENKSVEKIALEILEKYKDYEKNDIT